MRRQQMDHDLDFLPAALKGLLQRSEHKTCGKCGQPGFLRCSRCQCQYYCSSDCQRSHFDQHKKNCKAIGKARKKIDTQYDVVAVGAAQLSVKLRVTVYKSNLADLLVKVAFEECETLLQGRMFYREALKIYAHPLTDLFLKAYDCHKLFTFLEERVMLMIMVCGGDTKELEPFFMNCGGFDVDADGFRRRMSIARSERGGEQTGGIDLVKCQTHTAYFVTRGCLTQSNQQRFQWHFFWLLAYIMKLSKYRENMMRLNVLQSALGEIILDNDNQRFPWDDIKDHIDKYLIGEDKYYYTSVLPNNIREAMDGIRRSNHGDDLVTLKNADPFTRDCLPGLFSGLGNSLGDDTLRLSPMDRNMVLSEISFGGGAPPECWMIYKRCILESFGGSEIIQEFIIEG